MAQGPSLVRRMQLGRELRRLREQAGLKPIEVARLLDRDVTVIYNYERGHRSPTVGEVKLLLQRFGLAEDGAEWDRIVEIAREARKRDPVRVPDYVRAYVSYEAEATEIKQFENALVPGLLQTEAYARAITRAGDPTRDPAEVDRLVAIRRERQARLTSNDAPRLWVIMSEAVIRRLVGFGKDVMLEQLERLRETTELGTVSIQIIPYTAHPHPAMGTSFSVLRLPELGTQVVYLEDLWTAEYQDKEPQVTMYSQVFDTLCHVALDPASTAKMITEIIGELR
jgi:transcriptional regulator with XRE-family HTH domain